MRHPCRYSVGRRSISRPPGSDEWRVRPHDTWRRRASGCRIEVQEERADAGGALHEPGLRDHDIGCNAVLRLHPRQAIAVRGGAAQRVGGDATHHLGVARVRHDTIEREKVLTDAAVTTTLTDVVPEARGALLGHAARLDRGRGASNHVMPALVGGCFAESIEEARETGRPMAPAQIEERLATRLVMENLEPVTIRVGDRLEICRAGERRIEKRAIARRLIE